MWTRHRKRRNLGRLIVPFACAIFVSYFGYHAVNGSFGLKAQQRLEADRERLSAELEHLVRQRLALEKRATLLTDGSLERDMVDAEARRALNMVRPDELVILR
jgi:cell division protein FtsB